MKKINNLTRILARENKKEIERLENSTKLTHI